MGPAMADRDRPPSLNYCGESRQACFQLSTRVPSSHHPIIPSYSTTQRCHEPKHHEASTLLSRNPPILAKYNCHDLISFITPKAYAHFSTSIKTNIATASTDLAFCILSMVYGLPSQPHRPMPLLIRCGQRLHAANPHLPIRNKTTQQLQANQDA